MTYPWKLPALVVFFPDNARRMLNGERDRTSGVGRRHAVPPVRVSPGAEQGLDHGQGTGQGTKSK